ncbi:unnamed protein product, partial [Effrenium voratum]
MVLIEDVDEEEEREALKAAAKAASQQWRRIQVVQEDSDDDAPVAPAASEQSVQHSGVSDPCPDLSILCSRAGAEEAKRHGNRLFGEGKVAECERWFSKALWLYESGRVRDFPGDLRCALHSNRALARLKLQRFRDAEEDCSAALEDNPQNAKARYRRAMARLELGKLVPGLEDVERALKELPEDSRQEAQDLKVRIQEQLATPEGPAGTAKQPTPKGREKKEPTKAEDSGYKRIHVKEVDEDKKEASKPETTAEKTHVNGHAQQEPYPDIQLEPTMQGAEKAKQRANELFQKGSLEESARWFSKAIWLLESGKVPGATASLRSVLHSNRAFARSKLQQWTGVEEDCTEALALNESNAKALYRRSQARLELNKLDAALEDVQQLLPLLAAPADQEAQDLKKRILEQQAKAKKTLEKAKEASVKAEQRDDAKAPPPAGFKRMEIVEASDSEEEEASDSEEEETKAAAKVEAPKAVLTSSQDQKDKEMFPELKFEFSRKGVEAAKNTGGQLFSKQDLQGASRHFSKALWMLQSGKVADAQSDASWCNATRLALHSNRAFSELRQENWKAAEDDCTEALKIDPKAVKALYRRAMAREKMGRAAEALKDADEALKLQPGAEELATLQKRLKAAEPPAQPKSPEGQSQKTAPPPAGLKRMEIVEASDSDEDEPAKTAAAKVEAATAPPTSEKAPPPAGFKRMEIVEASDSDEDEPAKTAAAKVEAATAPPTSEKEEPAKTVPAKVEAAKATPTSEKATKDPEMLPEMLPELTFEFSRKGVEAAKSAGSQLFSKQDLQGASRHFSKALWMLQSGKVADASDVSWCNSTRLALHLNRAFSELRQENWQAAEDDCAEALKIEPQAVKALYRRAMAREKMGRAAEALKDVEEALKLQPGAEELVALQKRLKPAPKAETGFKRMEIVEASDDDEEAQEPSTQATSASTSPKAQEAGPPADSEPCEPWDELEPTLAGVEKGKEMGNRLFSEGKIEECERWFSKAIWLAEESGKVNVPSDLRGILHSNRAFARLRLQQWLLAEEDCTQALVLNASNSKALYRRAQARLELGKRSMALEDVDKLLPMLAPPSDRDAQELRERILALPESPAKKAEMFPDLHFEFSRKGVEAAKDAGSQLFSKQDLQGASRHFSKALWMLESGKVADAESDASWCNSTRLALHSNRAFSELRQGNWQAAEEDCTEALKINPQAVKALYRRAIAREELGRKEEALKDAEAALALQPGEELVALQKRLKAATETPGVEAVKRTETEAKAPSASPTPKEAPEPEPFDDIKLEPTLAGVEKGKEMGNKLFSAGKFEECERCFSKALWLAQESGKVKAPNDIRGILHSNRAFARLRLQRWSDAEKDCDEALRLNERNAKALYRRAMARQQLEKPKAALADLEQLLPMLDGNSNKDALALKEELLAQLRPSSPKALQKEAAKPAESSPQRAALTSRVVHVLRVAWCTWLMTKS